MTLPRHQRALERPGLRSHGERGNDRKNLKLAPFGTAYLIPTKTFCGQAVDVSFQKRQAIISDGICAQLTKKYYVIQYYYYLNY